jgi:hypothetical protein
MVYVTRHTSHVTRHKPHITFAIAPNFKQLTTTAAPWITSCLLLASLMPSSTCPPPPHKLAHTLRTAASDACCGGPASSPGMRSSLGDAAELVIIFWGLRCSWSARACSTSTEGRGRSQYARSYSHMPLAKTQPLRSTLGLMYPSQKAGKDFPETREK